MSNARAAATSGQAFQAEAARIQAETAANVDRLFAGLAAGEPRRPGVAAQSEIVTANAMHALGLPFKKARALAIDFAVQNYVVQYLNVTLDCLLNAQVVDPAGVRKECAAGHRFLFCFFHTGAFFASPLQVANSLTQGQLRMGVRSLSEGERQIVTYPTLAYSNIFTARGFLEFARGLKEQSCALYIDGYNSSGSGTNQHRHAVKVPFGGVEFERPGSLFELAHDLGVPVVIGWAQTGEDFSQTVTLCPPCEPDGGMDRREWAQYVWGEIAKALFERVRTKPQDWEGMRYAHQLYSATVYERLRAAFPSTPHLPEWPGSDTAVALPSARFCLLEPASGLQLFDRLTYDTRPVPPGLRDRMDFHA